MTCRLAPGRVHNTLPRPRAASLTDRTEQDAAPRGFLTGRSLIYTKEGRTEALQGSTCVSSSGLWAGALCWKLGVTYGEYHTPGAENAHASPSTHLVSSPQDASLPGRRLCSSQQAAEPWPGTAGARPGEQRCHGLLPGSCGAARHPLPNSPHPLPRKAGPREERHRAVGTQPDFLPPALLSFGPISAHPPAPGARHGAAQLSRKHTAIRRRRKTRRAGAMAPHTRTTLPPPLLQPQ